MNENRSNSWREMVRDAWYKVVDGDTSEQRRCDFEAACKEAERRGAIEVLEYFCGADEQRLGRVSTEKLLEKIKELKQHD